MPRFLVAGDAAVVAEFGDGIAPEINEAVLALDAAIAAAGLPGIVETVPTYRSLLVQFDPRATRTEAVIEAIRILHGAGAALPVPRRFTVPVAFGGIFGVDLVEVAARLGRTAQQVVEEFVAAEYRVYMVGFVPGFSYLGPLPDPLHLPRRETPRLKVPGGTVGIGGVQAAVYSVSIPSGWHLLGRTPARTFDKRRAEPFLFSTGDLLRFEPVTAADFERLEARADAGEWAPEPDR